LVVEHGENANENDHDEVGFGDVGDVGWMKKDFGCA
jgi:hypothetical protein